MIKDLTVLTYGNSEVVDSREVAEIVGKEHKNLLRDIYGYIKNLTESNFEPSDFFIESNYTDSTGRTLPCFLCTKKGCDMIANKLTGKKGVLFTANYVTAFEKMQNFIKNGARIAAMVPFPEIVQSVDIVAQSLHINDASKILMFHKLYESYNLPSDFLPAYEHNGSREMRSATALLETIGKPITPVEFNKLMLRRGFLEKKQRKGSKGVIKFFNALTENGLKYGENAISPYNQRETQPLLYVDSFKELYAIILN